MLNKIAAQEKELIRETNQLKRDVLRRNQVMQPVHSQMLYNEQLLSKVTHDLRQAQGLRDKRQAQQI